MISAPGWRKTLRIMENDILIRPVAEADAEAITRIYNHYVVETTVSFETEALTLSQMLQRMRDISARYPYYVAVDGGRVVGYCCVHQWKERKAYSHTLEVTIYLDPEHCGKGAGTMMMNRLLADCRRMEDCSNLIACITEENAASLAFHARHGFEKVSHFKRVGYKFGRWLDVVDMELML